MAGKGRYIGTPASPLPPPSFPLQAFDVALRERPSSLLTPVGRSFFSESFGSTSLGGGVAGWRGFYQSVRPTQQGLVLNVDVSATAFHEDVPVMDYVAQLLAGARRGPLAPNSSLTDAERVKVKRALNLLKVGVTHRQTPRR